MLRKLITAFAVAALGLVAFSGVAVADPGYPANEAPPAVSVDDDLVLPDTDVEFSGDGFTPGETITVEVLDENGVVLFSFTTVADANGHFSVSVGLGDVGKYTLRATGQTSGISLSKTVLVSAAAGNGGSDGGLAYTGASIAAPLAIGAGALITGLLLLFFGTRMAIRRKSHTGA